MAAAAGIVLAVGDDDGAVRGLGDCDGLGDGFGGRGGLDAEGGFVGVDPGQQRLGGGIGFGLRGGVGGDGGAAVREVGVGEAEAEGEFGRVVLCCEVGAGVHRRDHGGHEGALRGNRNEEVDLAEGAGPGRGAGDALDQQAHGLAAGEGHVDMGVGAKRNERIDPLGHRCGEVAMRIEADGERQGRGDGADAAEEFAFAVGETVDDHGAVKVEIEPVDRAGIEGGGEVGADHGGDALEGFVLHGAGGGGGGPGEGDEGGAGTCRGGDGAGDGPRRGAECGNKGGAAGEGGGFAGGEEVGIGGGQGGEGVAFVKEAADGNAQRHDGGSCDRTGCWRDFGFMTTGAAGGSGRGPSLPRW